MTKGLILAIDKPVAWLLFIAWFFILIFSRKLVIIDALPYLRFEEARKVTASLS